MKVYVASSWRNAYQPGVVQALRAAGHEVYDFRNPMPGNVGFAWRQVDPDYKVVDLTPERYLALVHHDVAERGFKLDIDALRAAHVVVMVTPCGLSAGLELGLASGLGKRTVVYVPEIVEPELMLKVADRFVTSLADLVNECGILDVEMAP